MEVVEAGFREYPAEFRVSAAALVPRVAHDLELTCGLVPPGGRIWDIGGGSGLFGVAAASLGFQVTNVDDFHDLADRRDSFLALQRIAGVAVIERDISQEQLPPPGAALDAVTIFHVLEHMHNSPRQLLHNLVARLRPGGALIVSVPNAANLRKRCEFPFGRVGWSSMQHWYDEPIMRGHTREPLARDLQYIADDLCLRDIRVFGRNFIGRSHPAGWRRAAAAVLDDLLRRRASLCSDLYLVGRAGEAAS